MKLTLALLAALTIAAPFMPAKADVTCGVTCHGSGENRTCTVHCS